MRQFSTVQYIDTCVGVWKLYFRQQMYLHICLWIFLSIDDKCWLQHMMSTTVYCCAPSNSKCKHDKKEPLANLSKPCCLNRPFLVPSSLAKGTSLELRLASQDGWVLLTFKVSTHLLWWLWWFVIWNSTGLFRNHCFGMPWNKSVWSIEQVPPL